MSLHSLRWLAPASWPLNGANSSLQLLQQSTAACCCAAAAAFSQQVAQFTSTAAVSSKQSKKQQRKQQQAPKDGDSSSVAAAADQEQQQQQHDDAGPSPLQLLQEQYQRCRMQDFYSQYLARELLLKLNLDSIEQLPKLHSIDLSISAKDLHGNRYVDKWQMLLPALALEYITGRPAEFVLSKLKYYRSRNAVRAVKTRVRGSEAMDLLQKLTYVVLPSQNAFSGISTRSLDRGGNLHFRVQRMVNFPDFEEQFEIFENLGALHVSINLGGVAKHKGRSQLLLTGLQLPMIQKGGGAAETEAAQQEPGTESDTESESEEDE